MPEKMPVDTPNDLGPAIDQIINAAQDEIIATRRDLHAHPETGFDLPRTAAVVANALRDMGLTPQEGVGRIGVVADVTGALPGPCVILRADMDALPIEEKTGLPFASTIPGKMHACGHDMHTASLLGAAKAIAALQPKLKGTIRLVFQPAEETTDSGAAAMIEDGVLEGADMAVGFHNMPDMPANDIKLTQGASMASCDDFQVIVKGVSGHAAHPHSAMDPIVGAASIIMQLQTIVSRRMNPTDPFVLTIGKIKGGDTENIIPDSCEFAGTIRCRSAESRALAEECLFAICQDGARAMGLEAEVIFDHGVPPFLNDAKMVSRAETALSAHFNRAIPVISRSEFGCEDFALFAEALPSLHFLVGSGQPGREDRLHNSDYQPDESSLTTSAKALARLAFELTAHDIA